MKKHGRASVTARRPDCVNAELHHAPPSLLFISFGVLSNAYLIAKLKIAFDTAETEPGKVCPLSASTERVARCGADARVLAGGRDLRGDVGFGLGRLRGVDEPERLISRKFKPFDIEFF